MLEVIGRDNMTRFKRMIALDTLGPDVLRLALCAISFTHGFHRVVHGDVSILGQILHDEGLPFGLIAAWLICIAETIGVAFLAFRLLVLPVSLVLFTIYFTGIMMFHRHNGFFVVGASQGGWEYNALLCVCLLVVAWENRAHSLY